MRISTIAFPRIWRRHVKATIEDWKKNDKVKRLWARDASLWTNTDESKWLGWLGIVEEQTANLEQFKKVANDIRTAGFTMRFFWAWEVRASASRCSS